MKGGKEKVEVVNESRVRADIVLYDFLLFEGMSMSPCTYWLDRWTMEGERWMKEMVKNVGGRLCLLLVARQNRR